MQVKKKERKKKNSSICEEKALRGPSCYLSSSLFHSLFPDSASHHWLWCLMFNLHLGKVAGLKYFFCVWWHVDSRTQVTEEWLTFYIEWKDIQFPPARRVKTFVALGVRWKYFACGKNISFGGSEVGLLRVKLSPKKICWSPKPSYL